MIKSTFIAIGVLGCTLLAPAVYAADHVDGPRASADPSADITDVFAWMSPDAQRINLVMDLVRNASASSRFSDSVQYVFHTESRPSFGAPAAPEVDVVCVFDQDQHVQCFAGNEAVVSGDASDVAGIASADGKLRVFTGLRNDPFFLNLAGFRETARIVTTAAPSLTFDPAGCPLLDATTAGALVTQLQSAPGGGPAVNSFANFNVLAIVVSVDKSILTKGGPIVGVAASTNRL
jgi:hypothetical protein